MSPFRNLPVSRKLVMVIMYVTLTMLLLAGITIILYDIYRAKENLGREITTQARLIGNRSSAALIFDDKALARENLWALQESPNVVMACIYDRQGGLFAAYQATGRPREERCPAAPERLARSRLFESEYLHVTEPIELGRELAGYIYIRSGLQQINQRVYSLIYAILGFMLVGALIAYWMSRAMQRLISVPLIKLASIATTVEKRGDYSLRVPDFGNDEIGRLSRALNAMLETIEKQNRELLEARDNLEAIVAERTRELEATNKELTAFSYSVSHDLRAPLRAIDGFSHAMMEDYSEVLDETGKDYLRRVRAASHRMSDLIDGLLVLSRISRDEMVIGKVDLSSLAHNTINQLKAGDPGRKVEVAIADGLTCTGDHNLLMTLLDNLLGNAWKYTSRKPHARIEFGATEREGGKVYYVRDNGAGFNMKYAVNLFGPFQRLHKAEEFPGTGIGLATVQRIVHRHGGRVWAEAAPDKGATFYFTLGPCSE